MPCLCFPYKVPAKKNSSVSPLFTTLRLRTLHFWSLNMWSFLTLNNSPVLRRDWLGVLQIKLNSDTPPGDSIRSHRLTAQSHKTALTLDASLKFVCHLDFWLTMTLSSGLIICYKGSQNSGKYLLIYCKRTQFRNSQMEELHRTRHGGKGVEFPCPLQVCHPSSISAYFPTWRLIKSPCLKFL